RRGNGRAGVSSQVWPARGVDLPRERRRPAGCAAPGHPGATIVKASNGVVAMTGRGHVIAAALVLSCFVVAATTSMAQKSATLDDPVTFPAASSFSAPGDFRFTLDHPPLIKMLAALPLFALHLRPPAGSSDGGAGSLHPETAFVFKNTRPARTIVFW